MGPSFTASADFAIDKPEGTPCRHLRDDDRCGIHDRLRDRGFPGCTVFDCFGAGQHAVQVTCGGRSWRDSPELAGQMFAVLPVLRQLHEVLWHLAEVLGRPGLALTHSEASRLRDDVEALAGAPAPQLLTADLGALRARAGELFARSSALVRGIGGPSHRGADLMGRDLRRVRLRDADLRGAYLIGVDLRGVDLGAADLLGTDLRAADLRATDLSATLFLTQPQVTAARGDDATRLPAVLSRPGHWR